MLHTHCARVVTHTIVTCHTPHTTACTTSAHTHCQISYQTVCTRTYNQTAGMVCERHPVRLCGAGCIIRQEEEDSCQEKDVATIVEVPEENCDLQPRKSCRMETQLVPSLKPTKECTQVPLKTCQLRIGKQSGEVRLDTEWCQEEDD